MECSSARPCCQSTGKSLSKMAQAQLPNLRRKRFMELPPWALRRSTESSLSRPFFRALALRRKWWQCRGKVGTPVRPCERPCWFGTGDADSTRGSSLCGGGGHSDTLRVRHQRSGLTYDTVSDHQRPCGHVCRHHALAAGCLVPIRSRITLSGLRATNLPVTSSGTSAPRWACACMGLAHSSCAPAPFSCCRANASDGGHSRPVFDLRRRAVDAFLAQRW